MSHESESNLDPTQTIVSKVAEAAISTVVNSVGKIDVKLDSELPQMLQGKVDSLEIVGEKIVAVQDICLEKIDISCEDVSVNLFQALLGQVAFEKTGEFQVKLVFTESDCDRLLNSKYVKTLLQNLRLDLDPQPSSFYLQQSKCQLAEDNLSLQGTIVLQRQQLKTALFEISFYFEDDGSEIGFLGGKYSTESALSLTETVAIMNKVRDLLYLRQFENEDLAFKIIKIAIANKQLILQADTKIKRLPDSISQSIESVSSKINN